MPCDQRYGLPSPREEKKTRERPTVSRVARYIGDPKRRERRDRFVTALLVPADDRAIDVRIRESLLPLLTARRERRGTGTNSG